MLAKQDREAERARDELLQVQLEVLVWLGLFCCMSMSLLLYEYVSFDAGEGLFCRMTRGPSLARALLPYE